MYQKIKIIITFLCFAVQRVPLVIYERSYSTVCPGLQLVIIISCILNLDTSVSSSLSTKYLIISRGLEFAFEFV